MSQQELELSTMIYEDTLDNINEILIFGKEKYILDRIKETNKISKSLKERNCVTANRESKIRMFYNTAVEIILNHHPIINN
jgi:hypothetical protein